MKHEAIEKRVKRIKKHISGLMEQKHWEEALSEIALAAHILYDANLYYVDEDLEDDLSHIAKEVVEPAYSAEEAKKGTIVFYDDFGLDSRGLAQIYLKALVKERSVIYIASAEARERIPTLLAILKQAEGKGSKTIFLKNRTLHGRIQELKTILNDEKPAEFIFYSNPDDVVGVTILNAYEGIMKRYQINLTDHAFWLGARAIDTCVEFRDYGGSISAERRRIAREKLVQIPFYPIIHYEQEFQGFPFPVKEGQKIIFSGGGLYKTIGKGNLYYKIVEYLLDNYPEAVFWYAGAGDRRYMDELIQKYPNRIYLTAERTDLYQVLEHCYLYLSTYPIPGGLMFQYAASAGKVPLTLKSGEIIDGFLLQQEQLRIQFDDLNSYYAELNHLMQDEEYNRKRGNLLKTKVFTEERFEHQVQSLLEKGVTDYNIMYAEYDTRDFHETYLNNYTYEHFCKSISSCMGKKGLAVFTIDCSLGYLFRLIRKVQRFMKGR